MIPTYNEKENIVSLVTDIFRICKGVNIHIVIVDDNSPDGTGLIAENLKKKNTKIHVLHRKVRGRGTAGIDGFKYCLKLGADYIIEMDSDFSHNPMYLPLFLEQIKKHDVVIGSRFIKGGDIPGRSFLRNFFTNIINLYLKIIFNTGIRDVSGGFKCYTKESLECLNFDKLISTKYSIGAEILYLIHKRGFDIKEIPIVFTDRERGVSKCDFWVMTNYIFTILKIKFKYLFRNY